MKEFKIRASQISKIMGNAKAKGELSAVCTTYLKEWYAEKLYCDNEEIRSKYFDKGNLQENEAIEEVVNKFDLGLGFKNLTFFTRTPSNNRRFGFGQLLLNLLNNTSRIIATSSIPDAVFILNFRYSFLSALPFVKTTIEPTA